MLAVCLCRIGGVEAGMFCALWTLRDQLLSEKCADFYQVCKLYHYKRPGIIGSKVRTGFTNIPNTFSHDSCDKKQSEYRRMVMCSTGSTFFFLLSLFL